MKSQTSTASEYFQKLSNFLLTTETTIAKRGNLQKTSLDEGAKKTVDLILGTKSNTSKIMLIGNGGSAAIVSHMQNDLCDCVGVRAMVFNEAPFLTAISNDHGYETFFEQAVKLWIQKGDVLIAISSSGKSKSILNAVRTSKERGGKIITFSGFLPDNPLRQIGDINFYVSSQTYGLVETAHAALGHFITDRAAAINQGK